MSTLYAYTPQIWPPILMVVLMIALSVFSYRRRSAPGALQLMTACLFAAAWAACLLMNYAAVDTATKIFWLKIQAIVQLPILIAITCFILEYAWPRRWLTRRNLVLLYFPILPSVILLLTNDLHHQAWRSFSLVNGALRPQFGLGSWILAFYFFGVLEALNLVVFVWLFRRSPQHRWPVALMLAGQIVGRSLFLLYNANPRLSALPLNILGMSLEFLIYAAVLFGFRIFDPISLARQTTVEQLKSGMMVLDPQGAIVSLNPAAAGILGSSAKSLLGRPIQDLLPADSALVGDLQATEVIRAEISLETGSETRCYEMEYSTLKDFREQVVGRLLLLHDVTEQKRAQAQLLEQQRALAMLHERERLARELHDSIGQTLGYAGFQLEAASKLVQDGQAVSAIAQINRLAGIVREAHDDLRAYILDLHSAPAPQQPFFSALRRYLKGYTNNYGIQVALSIDERLGEEPFSLDERMEVYRILQEALSNARKHAQARCVQVAFTLDEDCIRMTIQDDGAGFDPTQSPGEGHFGLRFMHERAEQIGGVLRVDSAPGGGTQVNLEMAYARTSGR